MLDADDIGGSALIHDRLYRTCHSALHRHLTCYYQQAEQAIYLQSQSTALSDSTKALVNARPTGSTLTSAQCDRERSSRRAMLADSGPHSARSSAGQSRLGRLRLQGSLLLRSRSWVPARGTSHPWRPLAPRPDDRRLHHGENRYRGGRRGDHRPREHASTRTSPPSAVGLFLSRQARTQLALCPFCH